MEKNIEKNLDRYINVKAFHDTMKWIMVQNELN